MTSSLEQIRRTRALTSMLTALSRVHLLRAGTHLGLFEALRRPHGEGELAERLGLARDLVSAWLRAAHAHGLVRRARQPDGAYTISGFVRWLLDAPESASLLAVIDQAVETQGPIFEKLPEFMKGAERPEFGAPEQERQAAEAVRLVESRALEALGRVPGASAMRRVLDIGCGYGTYLTGLLLRYRDAQGIGVERNAEVAEEARRRLREAEVSRRGEVRVGDFMTMELPQGTFDLILLNNNLYYFPTIEHGALFRRVLARLAEGGVLAIQIPVITEHPAARATGLTAATAAFDLFLRAHRNLHSLPDLRALHATLKEVGFASVGETAILAGGAARYVWARVANP